VFLSRSDLERLAAAHRMDYTSFIKTGCRWAGGWPGVEYLSLKEKANYDCVFWDNGCTVYHARPLQCRTFPFWKDILASRGAWESAASSCPGMENGKLHSREEIESFLAAREQEPVIGRSFSETGGLP
jgi:Fe-S-cluster containining protein